MFSLRSLSRALSYDIVLFVPGSILTVGCGFAFGSTFGTRNGVALATVAVFVGASCGSVSSFLLGRYLFKDLVQNLIRQYPVFDAIDRGETTTLWLCQ